MDIRTNSGDSVLPPVSAPMPDLEAIRENTRQTLRSLLGEFRDVALLDIPTHENVGDNMIWKGEQEYLRQLGRKIAYEADIFRMSDDLLRRRLPQGPILLHGGGNFGDIWPLFQDFRESVAERFTDRKIIQLPQTVFFKDDDRAEQANRVLSAHPDFTLMVRDHNSYQRALRCLPDVRVVFCPDMALGWSPAAKPYKGSRELVVLARQDREASIDLKRSLEGQLSPGDLVRDWRLRGISRVLWLATRIPGRLARLNARLRASISLYHLVVFANHFNRSQNLRTGVRFLSRGHVVVTDRLHAHVLASLLSIPNVVVDNNYGKVSSIYYDYTHVFDVAKFVSDPHELGPVVDEFLHVLTPGDAK